MLTFDNDFLSRAQTRDSTGAFLIGQLEKLDPTLNEPLVNITWSRDVQLREDLSIAMETASWSSTGYASNGGLIPNGKAWVGKDSNAIASLAVDIGKTGQPLYPWAMELGYTMLELASSVYLGQPIDLQKMEGIKLKHQMDIDEQVYIGDTTLAVRGLLNSASVTAANVANGAGGSPLWAQKTPTEILADVNELLTAVWNTQSAMAACPDKLLLPPVQFGLIASTLISNAGNQSVLSFLKANSICLAVNGRELDIKPSKWLPGQGAAATDRMMAYTQSRKFLQFPLIPLQRAGPLEYRSLWQLQTYVCRIGVMEFRYPETIGYRDGI